MNKKQIFFGFFIFFIGLLGGISLCLSAFFFLPKDYLSFHVGKFLDEDYIILKSGAVIRGTILDEGKEEIVIAMDQSTIKFKNDEIDNIHRNHFTRYLEKSF